MGPSEFNGFADTGGKRIVLVEDSHRQVLMVDGRAYMQWAIEDVLTKRLVIVQLHQLQVGSYEQIAVAFVTPSHQEPYKSSCTSGRAVTNPDVS